MDRTLFAGLTRLEQGESLQTDNGSFQSANPEIIDRFLEIGAVTHRHDAHAAQADPVGVPSASAVASGGHIPGGLPLVFGYTLLDHQGGETLISPLVTVTTDPPLDPPSAPPLAEIDYTAGTLLTDTYYYAVSLVDGTGGETPIGEAASVEREPGFASAQVLISDLEAIMEESGAAGWRLWRAQGAGDFFLIAAGTGDTFTDDGVGSLDATVAPLTDTENFTNSDNSVWVVVPDSDEMATASAFSLYMSATSDFGGPSMVGTFPLSSAGAEIWVDDLDVGLERPPDVSTCVRGASKIDPDVELLDWPWRRPVATHADLPATTEREIRVVLDENIIYLAAPGATGPDDWQVLYPDAARALERIEDDDEIVLGPFWDLQFLGSGGIGVDVAPGSAAGLGVVTVSASAIGGGSLSVWDDLESVEYPDTTALFFGAGEGATLSIGAGAPGEVVVYVLGPVRHDVEVTAPALASGASAAVDQNVHAGWRLLRAVANQACRLRLYPTDDYRVADAARPIGTAPTGNHGVLAEVVLPSGDLDYAIAPAIEGYNLDDPLHGTMYATIDNMDALGDVTVTLTVVQSERS